MDPRSLALLKRRLLLTTLMPAGLPQSMSVDSNWRKQVCRVYLAIIDPLEDEYSPWERWPHSDVLELGKLQLFSGSGLKDTFSGEWPLKDNYSGECLIGFADLVSIALSRFGADSSIFLAAQAVVNADRVKLARRSGLSNMCEMLAFNIGIWLSRKAIKRSSERTW